MKILKISLKNLNSLAGKWHIDFTCHEITGSGIFAITGPTGAGKSTILDAICLALYGQTPRLDRISKSANEIMTRQTGECFAEVEFLTLKGRFRCHWSQHRARRSATGELQPQKHEIVDAETGKVLETRLRLVEKKVIDVTGLDFRQFTRSILLAQGEFDTFLKARPDERAPILEQITGTEIYSRISQKVHELKTAEEELLNRIRLECEGFNPLSSEEKLEIDTRLAVLGKELATLEQDISDDRILLSWYDEQEKATREIERLTELQSRIETERNAALPDQELLERGEAAQKIARDHLRLSEERKLQGEDIENLERSRTKLQSMENTLREQEALAASRKSELKQQQEQFVHNQRIFNEVRNLDQKIIHLNDRLNEQQREHKKEEEKRTSNRKLLRDTEQKITTVQAALHKIDTYRQEWSADEQLTTELSGLEERFNTCARHKDELDKSEQAIKDTENRIDGATKGITKMQGQLTVFQKKRATLENEAERLEAQSRDILDTSTIQEIGIHIAAIQVRLSCLEKLSDRETRKNHLEAERKTVEDSIRVSKDQQLQLEASLKILEEKIRAQKRIIEKQEHIVYQAAAIQDLTLQRTRLQEGEPCPLCGSRDHPYTKDLPAPGQDEERARLEKEKAALDELSNERTQAIAELTGCTTRLQQLFLAKQEKGGEFDKVKQQVHELLKQLDLQEEDLSKDHFLQLQNNLDQEKAELQARVDSYYAVDSRLKKTSQSLSETRQEIAAAEQQLALARQHVQQLQDKYLQLKQETQSLQERLSRQTAEFAQHISPYHPDSLPPPDNAHFMQELRQRKQQWMLQTKRHADLTEKLQNLTADRNQYTNLLQANIEKAEEIASDITEHLRNLQIQKEERVAIFGDENPDIVESTARRKLQDEEQCTETLLQHLVEYRLEHTSLTEQVKHLSQVIAARKETMATLKKEFSASLAAQGFLDEEDFLSAILTEERLSTLNKRMTELHKRSEQTRTLLDSEKEALAALAAKNLTQSPRPQIQSRVGQKEEHASALLQNKGALMQKLDDNEKLLRRHAEKVAHLSRQQDKFNQWKILHDLIGSADGKKFRNFAQGLTFELMISHANRSLAKMSDRYILVRDSDQPLELQIIDNYQAGERRSVKNLSGGESFLVSLALALGLSGMASRNVRVDSLFLDEGFGTLDEESLQTALDILSSLHREGKLIGIISHVAALRERIPAHIQVIKETGGRSRLTGAGTGA